MKWTDEQQMVIDVRDRNILVSAAAGSGKTAVLVERILKIIMDKDNPVDIDKLLIVTFTRAAANEMRERILNSLEDRLYNLSPEEEILREHLEKQCTYIHNAKITTIDSFCQEVIKENISLTDIDPGYRIADNSEIVLMTEDALKNVLDRWYDEMLPEFMDFVDTYSAKVGDDNIERLIEKLYRYAQSYPNPVKWLKDCTKQYAVNNIEEWKESASAKYIVSNIRHIVDMVRPQLEEALSLCTSENGLDGYLKAINEDIEFAGFLAKEEDVEKLLDSLKNNSYARFGKATGANEDAKSRVTLLRKAYKDAINGLVKKYTGQPVMTIVNAINACRDSVDVLVKLTLDFDNEFTNIKREKNVLDFSDVEHIALDILTKEVDGKYIQSPAAKEMADDFVEIMIDEYQDSNLVQETILNAVSKANQGKNNIFMVGDVKQSIYKFRQARPELFMEKYNRYPSDLSSDEVKIVLSKNFRSRQEVLDSANLVFSQVMGRELGGIEYDAQSKLYLGMEYEQVAQKQDTELIMIDSSKEKIGRMGQLNLQGEQSGKDEGAIDELEKLELEAVVVANRIKELMNSEKPFLIRDKATGLMRPVQYKDIVILFRSKTGVMEKYMDILTSRGIPAVSALKESMLNTFEINVILNFLRVIDNPKQDIAFVSVLKHVFSYTENQLAQMRFDNKKESFYDSFLKYEGQLKEKNHRVLSLLEKYRHYATYMPIYRLIKSIISETGFYDFVSAMPNGEQRLYNIDIFIKKAEGYAKGTYTGLFNFVRYIEKLKTYKADISDDASFSMEEDSVKLMTIHKSKGLEFPVVFVAALGKQYSVQDVRSKVVMHNALGIGIDRIDLASRIKYKTVVKEMIIDKINEENLAEEIRVLYVALTRAKEKLILVGSGKVSERIEKMMEFVSRRELALSKEIVRNTKSFLDLIILSLIRHESFDNVRKLMRIDRKLSKEIYSQPGKIEVTILDAEEIIYDATVETTVKRMDRETLLNWDTNRVYSEEIRQKLNERFSYVYKYENDTRIRAKHSVSDIKHAKMEIDEFVENKMHLAQDDEEYVPIFMREVNEGKEDINGGALRGTAVHRFFELFDYDRDSFEIDDIKNMMQQIKDKALMTNEELLLVSPWVFEKFMRTNLGKRMQQAYKEGLLFRERPFVMGMKAKDVDETYDSDEPVVVQGIIDAFFYEDNEVVIVDYKTDSVERIEDLVGRYKAQLDCYADAIRKVTGKQVKEKIIYSTKFNDVIIIK